MPDTTPENLLLKCAASKASLSDKGKRAGRQARNTVKIHLCPGESLEKVGEFPLEREHLHTRKIDFFRALSPARSLARPNEPSHALVYSDALNPPGLSGPNLSRLLVLPRHPPQL